MKRLFYALVVLFGFFLNSCSESKQQESMNSISKEMIEKTINKLSEQYPDANPEMIQRGVRSAGAFWTSTDGTEHEFSQFCMNQFVSNAQEKEQLFQTLQTNFEILMGNYNKISVDLKLPLHVVGNPITEINEAFGAFDPMAHFSDDMFSSKIAFTVLLNFPFYNLEEKNSLGKEWSRLEWGYARMGDLFTSRVPAQISQNIAQALADADGYISNYNIMMGELRSELGEKYFPDNMALITHWGLRDELKSNYSNVDGNGLEKQEIIYEVMKHIVRQTIPQDVISNADFTWQPYSNRIFKNNVEQEVTVEPDTRYNKLHAICMAVMAEDKYNPTYPSYIQRSFNQAMEVSVDDIEQMFVDYLSSPQVAQGGALIKSRLGRELRPFYIWYDGFKSRSSIAANELDAKTKGMYPTAMDYENDLSNTMVKLGFTPEKSAQVASKITVDPSRGAGHAWGAMMKSDKARLRTRVGADGMDYKGFNIATHEFGHNVEQTITLHDVDNYMMNGVPSTAFTEALAFVFQKKDLQLLGYTNESADQAALQALDIFWGSYEIMGVSLVDIYTWKWLYEHPNASAKELKKTIIDNATKVWNQYYAPILGGEDSPILAIYSHMIDIPLYLPNYPYGHIIEFQLENYLQGRNFGSEIERIYSVGRLTPNLWMEHAVGAPVSTEPLIQAAQAGVDYLKK